MVSNLRNRGVKPPGILTEAFWELFKEYEDAGGDGYIHTVVQPAMNLLKVIDIEDAVSVLRLTNNRK